MPCQTVRKVIILEFFEKKTTTIGEAFPKQHIRTNTTMRVIMFLILRKCHLSAAYLLFLVTGGLTRQLAE